MALILRTFMLAFSLIVLYSTPSFALEITLLTDDTPGNPYIMGGGTDFDWEKPGLEIEIYRIVAEKLDLKIKYKRIPWKLCLQQIEHNKVDGIFPASFKTQRMKMGVYPTKNGQVDSSRKSRDNGYFLYKLSESSVAWDGKSFLNLDGKIAAPLGCAVISDLKKTGASIKEVEIHPQSPDLLLYQRVSGFVCLETIFDAYLRKQPKEYVNIEKVFPPIWEKPYYLMLSHEFVKNNPELAERIWNTIAEVKQSKEFAEIANRYIK